MAKIEPGSTPDPRNEKVSVNKSSFEDAQTAAMRVSSVEDTITSLQDEVNLTIQHYITPRNEGERADCESTDRSTVGREVGRLRILRHEVFEHMLPQASALDLEPFLTELVKLGVALLEFERAFVSYQPSLAKLNEPFSLPEEVKGLFQKVRDTIPL